MCILKVTNIKGVNKMDINKVEWVDIFGNPIGTTEERYERLAKQIEEYNKKKEGK